MIAPRNPDTSADDAPVTLEEMTTDLGRALAENAPNLHHVILLTDPATAQAAAHTTLAKSEFHCVLLGVIMRGHDVDPRKFPNYPTPEQMLAYLVAIMKNPTVMAKAAAMPIADQQEESDS